MVYSRPDLSHALIVISRYMANPGKEHWKAVQWIFRYLRGTANACLQFGKSKSGFVGYVDSDYAGDLDKRRSLTGYVFTIGGCAVSWKVSLQATVALSTAEAEYMAISKACTEAVWLRGLYNELCGDTTCTTIFCDRVLYALQRIKCSMREQSILTLDITIFEVLLPKVISKGVARRRIWCRRCPSASAGAPFASPPIHRLRNPIRTVPPPLGHAAIIVVAAYRGPPPEGGGSVAPLPAAAPSVAPSPPVPSSLGRAALSPSPPTVVLCLGARISSR
ncbi:hypothetical protein U9M48_036131 [Paspalum notatum var. saurae]|uniref:Uncharacterized protein n=1 Tax=Paspalum notatum var. saurae TaxID=547442 RepID=A0AAQ3UGL3_PASNO